VNLNRGIWVSRFGGYEGCIFFSGKCHTEFRTSAVLCVQMDFFGCINVCVAEREGGGHRNLMRCVRIHTYTCAHTHISHKRIHVHVHTHMFIYMYLHKYT